jgi:preprotein translocase subunit SecD
MFFARWKIYAIAGICAAAVLLSLPDIIPARYASGLPSWVPWHTVNLGLDLRGGSYLSLEVDMPAMVRERLKSLADTVREKMRASRIQVGDLAIHDRSISFKVRDPQRMDEAAGQLRELVHQIRAGIPDLLIQQEARNTISMTLTEQGLRERSDQAIAQSIEIVRRRIDETGINEPQIAREGPNRILVQLPGVEDPGRIKQLLGTTARMTFRLVETGFDASGGAHPPPGVDMLPLERPRQGEPAAYPVRQRVDVEGSDLTDARASLNPQTHEWVVNFTLGSAGTRKFADVTRANVGKPFAIVLDDKVISAPVIREPIVGGRGQISGHFSAQSANDLAVLLRAGALPARLTVVEERTVGPDLGADSIRAGLISCLVGVALVFVYMISSYGLFGTFACVGLLFNLFLTIAALSLMHATLTLPGIAGILLALGLSVDANILINERIREEVRRGRTPFSAMEQGFSRAFSTIVDSNLTTLIKMLILFAFGTGPVRGFAVTISVGILTSMFTATVLVRLLMVWWLRSRRPALLPI